MFYPPMPEETRSTAQDRKEWRKLVGRLQYSWLMMMACLITGDKHWFSANLLLVHVTTVILT